MTITIGEVYPEANKKSVEVINIYLLYGRDQH